MTASEPTATMRPSLMATLAAITQSGVTTLPLRMRRSAPLIVFSQCRPAAVDRQIDPGDLARNIACQKQAGVGNVGICRDALERVFVGVALCCLFLRYAQALCHVGTDLVAEARTIDHARRNTVDIDVVGSELHGEAFGDAAQSPFRG